MIALPHRHTGLKVLHAAMITLMIWFTVIQPADVARFGRFWVDFHSVMGLIFVSLALLLSADYFQRGLASRPGPKLPTWARHTHVWLHRVIIWDVFLVAVGGFFIGLTASRQLWAGNIVPIAVPLNMPQTHDIIGTFHTVKFYLLAVIIAGHAAFHIWRHYGLRNNALRIMAPKALHKFL
jgi:cytochrome b561